MGKRIPSHFPLLVTALVLNIFLTSPGLQLVKGDDDNALTCDEGQLACADGSKCYSVSEKCDKIPDCLDGSDENDCELVCDAGDLPCKPESICLPDMYKCDGMPDCSDNSDEMNCDSSEFECQFESEFKCASELRCIVGLQRCDGIEHCLDGSDERDCEESARTGEDGADIGGPSVSRCSDSTYYDCMGDGSECIKDELVCNGQQDCSNGRDESNVTCAEKRGVPVVARSRPGAGRAKSRSDCDAGNPCAHHCDPLHGQYVCSCETGYRLAEDKISCMADGDEPQLIYANNSQLVVYGLRTHNRSSISINTIVQGIAYDHISGKIFYIDYYRKSINWISKSLDGQPITLIDKYVHEPVSLAFDWVHGTLYWADVSPTTGSAYSRIEAVTIGSMYRTTVLTAPAVRDPRQLAVDPRPGKGYLYWAQIGTSPSICRSGLDGSDPNCFVTTDILQPSGLTIDYLTNTLYWIDKHSGHIVSYDLERLERHIVAHVVEYPRHPTSLDVFEDILYWADDMAKSVYKWNVLTTDHAAVPSKVFDNLDTTKDVVVYHPQRFPQGESYCGANNGGCSHICLPSPHFKRFTCACPNVEKAKNGTVAYVLDASGRCTEKKVLLPTTIKPSTVPVSGVRPGESDNGGQGSGNEKQEKEGEESGGSMMWIAVGAGIGVVVLLVVIAIVIWRVLATRRANMMQFANPSFETKPLNKPVTNGHNGVHTSAA